MGSKPMPRPLLYGAALTIACGLLFCTLQVTTHGVKAQPCEHCGSKNIRTDYMESGVLFTCRRCGHMWDGPKKTQTFSWLDVVETWLDRR